MKKALIFILVIILLAASGVGVYYYQTRIARLPIEKIFPDRPTFYLCVSNMTENLQEFKSSRLWKNIKGIDIEMLLQRSGLDQEGFAQYKKVRSDFSENLSLAESLLNGLFGQELALAVYPAKIKAFDAQAARDCAENIILATRLKPEVEFTEFVYTLSNKFRQNPKISPKNYKGYEINIIEFNPNLIIAYVKIRDILVLGFGENAARSCVDVACKDKFSFYQNSDYMDAMAELGDSPQTIVYGNLEAFFSYLKRIVYIIPETEEISFEQKAKALEAFDKMEGLKTIAFGSQREKIAQGKTVLTFDKDRIDLHTFRNLTCQPQENKTIRFIPQDVTGYQWNNCFSAELSWNDLQEELKQRMEEKLQIDIEDDILPALGNEVGGFLLDINLDGPFPIPEFLLFVKANERTILANALESLAKNSNLLLDEQQYKDAQIRYLSLPFGKSLEPGYCFLDDYLCLFTSRSAIKAAIDALADEALSLLVNNDFQSLNFGLTEKSNFVYFLQANKFFSRLKDLCAWGLNRANLVSANLKTQKERLEAEIENLKEEISAKEERPEDADLQRQGLAESQRQLEGLMQSPLAKTDLVLVKLYLEEAVYPILEGLEKTIQASASRSQANADIFIVETFSKIE